MAFDSRFEDGGRRVELDVLEPPVPWGTVQQTLDARRPDGPTAE